MSITFHPRGIWDEELTLNVANGNASVPCDFMNADPERGIIPAKFIDRAIVALGNADLTAHVRKHVTAGNHINFGLPFERLEEYWLQLHTILRYCEKHKLALEWG